MHIKEKEPKYISLAEAARISGYSQEYLSLRARKGKLKAVKIGRNWVTTEPWLAEYLNQVAQWQEENFSNDVEAADSQIDNLEKSVQLRSAIDRHHNELTKNDNSIDDCKVQTKTIQLKRTTRNQGFLNHFLLPKKAFIYYFLALSIVLCIGVIFLARVSRPADNLSTPKIEQNRGLVAVNGSESASGWVKVFGTASERVEKTASDIGQFFSHGFKFIIGIARGIKDWFSRAWFFVFNAGSQTVTLVKEKTQQSLFPDNPSALLENVPMAANSREGMVVFPSVGTEADEDLQERIKMSFSDEVRVEMKDSESGLIIPVFRAKEGQGYIYMMVPEPAKKSLQ